MRSLSFRAKEKTLLLGERTALMGVVNATPDSFHPTSRYENVDSAVDTALKLVDAGADVVDIGGESTRPGAAPVAEDEEIRRVVPVFAKLRDLTGALLSVDTRKPAVAARALAAGADVVNDVSALSDPRMAEVVAEARAGVVLMHMKGNPETMQREPRYDDVVAEVVSYLARAVSRAEAAGIPGESILVDPGIGFGKTVEHNLSLLNHLSALSVLGKPILVGTSHKSFLGRLLGEPARDRLLLTAASVACAVLRGAHVVRVHDVREMREVTIVADAIRSERREKERPPASLASARAPGAGDE